MTKNLFTKNDLYRAFPAEFKNDIDHLYESYDFSEIISNSNPDLFEADIEKQKISVPYRAYLDEKQFANQDQLSKRQHQILSCILTRNHDGYIRQKYLMNIICIEELWITPYIMQLMGEYVEEILMVIYKNMNSEKIEILKKFITLNPIFYAKTKRRIISYFDCYYKGKYKCNKDYVGMKIISKIESP